MKKQVNALLYFQFFNFLMHATPPSSIPEELRAAFTMDGQINVASYYCDDSYPPEKPLVYTKETIEEFKNQALQKQVCYYGATDNYLYAAFDKYRHYIEGKKIAILGSTIPWYEAIVLTYNGLPTTIEYNTIISHHPDVQTITVTDFEKNPTTFDALLSISSFEHDGLGRYGDPINPDGDLLAMQKAKQMLNPDGLLFLAVPVGPDTLAWNAHRIYGERRLKLLLSGWQIVETFGFYESDFNRYDTFRSYHGTHQPIFILRKQDN